MGQRLQKIINNYPHKGARMGLRQQQIMNNY